MIDIHVHFNFIMSIAVGPSKEMSTLKVVDSKAAKRGGTGSSSSLATPDHTSSLSVSVTLPYTPFANNNDKKLLITLAEVHCVYAEVKLVVIKLLCIALRFAYTCISHHQCLVHKLHSEGVQLGGVAKASSTDEQENKSWKNYRLDTK